MSIEPPYIEPEFIAFPPTSGGSGGLGYFPGTLFAGSYFAPTYFPGTGAVGGFSPGRMPEWRRTRVVYLPGVIAWEKTGVRSL